MIDSISFNYGYTTVKCIRGGHHNDYTIVYISRMVEEAEKGGQFYAFGRVFSGTAKSGYKVHLPSPESEHDIRGAFPKALESFVSMIGDEIIPIDEVPARNIVGLVGFDKCLLGAGTLTTIEKSNGLRHLGYTLRPVIESHIRPVNGADLPKVSDGCKWLARTNPSVMLDFYEELGEHSIISISDAH